MTFEELSNEDLLKLFTVYLFNKDDDLAAEVKEEILERMGAE